MESGKTGVILVHKIASLTLCAKLSQPHPPPLHGLHHDCIILVCSYYWPVQECSLSERHQCKEFSSHESRVTSFTSCSSGHRDDQRRKARRFSGIICS